MGTDKPRGTQKTRRIEGLVYLCVLRMLCGSRVLTDYGPGNVTLFRLSSNDRLRAMPHYQVNRPDVMMESFEGEVIIIHMKRGTYYSLRGSAPLIWDMIGQGCSVEKTADHLAAHYPAQEEEVRNSVRNLVEELIAEDLIAPLTAAPTASAETFSKMKVDGPFMRPLLERYTDMQELLLLDPIHEVDETGWPARKVQDEG